MAIKIKPSHRGLLHKNLGVKQGEKIPASKLAIKSSDSPAVKKRKQFALNAKRWHHGQSGLTLSTLPGSTVPETLPLPEAPEMLQYNGKRRKTSVPNNYGDLALMTIMAIDAAIPKEQSPYPVVRPSLTYNANQYGTYGSQAIAKQGITVSEDGYKQTSKDKYESSLRIPSNQITMKGVPHPVLGIDSLGNQQLMFPEEDYQFDGEYVDEFPLAQMGVKLKGVGSKSGVYTVPANAKDGKWIQGAVNPKHKGYCTPMTKSTCTPRRKAFAMTMKKHHGFHEDGGIIPLAGDGLSVEKAKEMLRDGTAHGKKLTAKQKRYFGYIAGGGTPMAKNGMTILDDSTVQFNGDKHSDPSGGIPIAYGGKKVMVEGDETGYLSPVDESLTIMGNMKNPLTGRKFKSDSKILSDKESKMDELMADGISLINDNDPADKWGVLKFNSGRAMAEGAHRKKKEIMQSKEHLKSIQQAMLETMPFDGTAQNGATLTKWQYNGTNTSTLDEKIKGFVSLLEQKGLSGYSGPESGVSKRNTKSGRPSRHASGEALDLFFSQPEAYDKILQDPELSGYLINNGLTALNEYNPRVAEKTGATAGHVHIGYDMGTPLSNAFRMEAARTYQKDHPDWNWKSRRSPSGKPINNAPQGDAQYFPYDVGRVSSPTITDVPQDNTPVNKTKIPSYDFNFTNPAPRNIPSNAQPLEFTQVLPELYAAATNKEEPVHLQKYQPSLYQPYDVSFQDQLNENQASFSALSRAAAYNPSALATLGAGKYSADSSVLANEFRTNQATASDVVNKNIALMNDAELKNLQLADTQYVRQSQAKSNTKAINHDILNSISSKLLQNEATNRRLQVYENLYDYRYNPDNNFQLDYKGAPGSEYIDWSGNSSLPDYGGNSSVRTRRDAQGNVKYTTTTEPSPTKTQLDAERLRSMRTENINKLFNTKKGKSTNLFDIYHY